MQYSSDKEAVDALRGFHEKLGKREIHKVIVGQDKVVEDIVLSIFSGGHTLLM
jgi:MoxR-like ATPase